MTAVTGPVTGPVAAAAMAAVRPPVRAAVARQPAGDGTGLGLSLSYDIVVQQHTGGMSVESDPGEYALFRVVLPRRRSLREEPT